MIIERCATAQNENLIRELSYKFSVSERFAAILVGRGINTVEKAEKFLNPSLSDVGDPYLMKGIKDAVKRILAVGEDETIVVYGDYDVDGISAATILTKALRSIGKNAYAVIPERKDGYGLSDAVIERALEEYCPDLLITVDCGIGAVNEVEYLKDLGVDVIVTDHHEIPDEVPDCIIVNCKFNDDYRYNALCGAGVAYNLVRALVGGRANDYLDLVALATLADSMPLTGENRALVSEGIKSIADGKCIYAIKALLKIANAKEISATSLTYSVAPRVNAAGRMGDAATALRAFLSEDKSEVDYLVNRLSEYNITRQADCETLYREAKSKLENKSPLLKVNILYDKRWNTGLVGIVSARLTEETGKPTILFTESSGLWHGSARSINSINIYEALRATGYLLEDFGGHSQAAGLTIKEQNIAEFETALDSYVSSHCSVSDMTADIIVDEIVKSPVSIEYAEELEKLEPCGTDNPKPVFAEHVGDVSATPLKYGSPHISLKTENCNLLYFNGLQDIKTLNSPINKVIIYEPAVSVFNGKKYVKGYIRSLTSSMSFDEYTDYALFASQLDSVGKTENDYETINDETAKELISSAKTEIFGTLFVISSPDTVKKFENELKGLDTTVFSTCKKSNLTTVCCGLRGCINALYERIVYLDKPLCVSVETHNGAKIFVNTSRRGLNVGGISIDRRALGEVYIALKNTGRKFVSVFDAYNATDRKFNIKQIAFAIKSFYELGLIKISDGKFYAVDGKGKVLDDSKVYRAVRDVING